MSFKNTVLPVQTMLQSKGRLLDISKPVVMGILNATPDSFYNKGRDSSSQQLLDNAGKMLADGATTLDVGGASSRPGAEAVSSQEEIDRVLPVITAIAKAFPDAWMSVDTYHAAVAKAAVEAGAHIINDISAGNMDADMLAAVATLQVPYIAMHMQGSPQTMQDAPSYTDVNLEVLHYLRQRVDACAAAGITDIIIDPGFGFGKTVAHNYALLNDMHALRMIGRPVLAGISRKGMVCKPLGVNPDEALNGSTALHMVALQQGAGILRVHDVREAMEVITLFQEFNKL